MRFLRYLVLFCIAVISGTVSAQSQRELGQLMRNRGEYYFTLTVDNPADIQSISKICSIDGTDGRTVVAYANQQEYNRLLQEGYQPNLQTPPSMREEAVMWQGGDRATYEWNSYLTYGDYVSMMEGFPSSVTNGASCTLLDLGTLSTTNHRRILGVRLNNGQPNGKPKFLYTSTMHGDEVTGMILMLRLINEFCTSSDSRIANILENVDLFIFPCTNPDGTYHGGNNTVNGATRANGNSVDLNRHFPDFDDGAHPDGASYYQDEAQWMMDLAQEYLFTMGANYHGGAEVMNYPWDTYQPLHPDDAWWQLICHEYADLAQAVSSSYMDDYNDGITNGYAWYTISGSRQDYMNYYGQCREVTIECSSTKTPSASQLPNFWNYNHNSMLALIEQCLNGVHGFVYDAVTLQPIEGVSVTVENHDALGSSVSSHTIGDFHRPIKGGTYTFTFAKQGYYPESVQVTVADDNREDLTIYLNPNLNLEADFTASTTEVSLGQSISFTDTSEGMVSSWEWTFEGATPSTSTEQNPTGIVYNTPGDYDVTLTITGPTGNTLSVTKENYIHVSESILMQNGTVTICSGLFYDSGGPTSNYANNLNYTMTFYPETEGAMMSVSFSQFNTESGYDYLYIYNGTSISAPQIGQYDGTTSPGTVMATNEAGALTFRFTSDSGVNAAGWVASVSCFYTDQPVNISVTANPSNGGTVSGGGEFTFGETCTVTATPENGYTFTGWTENGEVISNELEYSFTAINDRELVANFIHMTIIEIGESETTNNFLPSYSYYKQALTQQIYTAEEIGTAGTITSIAFYNEGTTRTRNYDFYLKATEKSSFSSKTDWITMATTDKVFSGSVTMTAGAWTTIFFDTPFEYDGTSNLVLVADDNTGNYDNSPYMACSVYSTETNQAIYIYSDNTNYNPMSPPTSSTGGGYGGNTNAVLTVKNHIRLGVEVETEEEQIVTLTQGWSWWSTNLDITMEELENAIAAVVGTSGTATIKSKSGSITYANGRWRESGATTMTLDIRQMYKIQTNTACQITLTGVPVDPAAYEITVNPGNNWIGFPCGESMSVTEAFSGLNPVDGDVIKGMNGNARYSNGNWRLQGLSILEPGQGYIYQSNATESKTFTFSSSEN